MSSNAKDRYYDRLEDIWELNYSGEYHVAMFHVRWAKSIRQEYQCFTTMVIVIIIFPCS